MVFTNVFEKLLFQLWRGSDRRPDATCVKNDTLKCLGMPSGHAEGAMILATLLLGHDVISIPFALCVVVLVCAQRVLWKRHTIAQVLVGSVIGFAYGIIYLNLMPWQAVVVATCIPIVLLFCILTIVSHRVHEPVPEWVDTTLYPLIEKKQKSPVGNALFHILSIPMFHSFALHCSWSQLEMHMDVLVSKVRQSMGEFDAVIGLKTGGAIISTYIANKLELPCYHVKMSADVYKCNKSAAHFYHNLYEKVFLRKRHGYSVCEPIKADLRGKKVLVVDELIYKGETMKAVQAYLQEEKGVGSIALATVCSFYEPAYYDFAFLKATDNRYVVWPWGFDN